MLESSVASLCIPCILCGKRKRGLTKHTENTEKTQTRRLIQVETLEEEWRESGQRLDIATTTTEEIR